jgi:predicted alpha/beta-hydrolase family hydrolase
VFSKRYYAHNTATAEGLVEHGYAVVRCSLVTTNITVRIKAMKAVLSYVFADQDEQTKVDTVVSKLRANVSRIYIGGHSFGARVVVSIGDELKDQSSPKTKKAAGSEKSNDKELPAEDFASKLQGIITFSYPLHPPGKQSELRDKILFDLPDTMDILMISGTKDPFGDLGLMTKAQNKMTCLLTAVRIEKAGHSLGVGKSKKTDKNTGRTQDQTLVHWMTERIDQWIKKLNDSNTGSKRKRSNDKVFELAEISFVNDCFKVSKT